MGETARQIEAHIEDTRRDLGSHLQELEKKVKTAADWRGHFRNKPLPMLGAAFGGGVLLAFALNGRTHRRGVSVSAQPHRHSELFDRVKDALVAVAATRFTDYISDTVPGFRDHFRRTDNSARQTMV
jgi:hypothetical protein